ncbi:unnamed protein product, partial [Dovyalis caffra]
VQLRLYRNPTKDRDDGQRGDKVRTHSRREALSARGLAKSKHPLSQRLFGFKGKPRYPSAILLSAMTISSPRILDFGFQSKTSGLFAPVKEA